MKRAIGIRSLPDFLSGLFFLAIGLAVMWVAGNYAPGTAARMGPGYFPRLLGGALSLLGIVITAQALLLRTSEGGAEPFPLRRVLFSFGAIAAFWVLLATTGKQGYTGLDLPVIVMLVFAFFASREMFWILAGIATFGVLLQPAGLVIASFALVVLASIASREFDWKTTVVSWLALLLLCLGVFVRGLGLQFPVLPAFLGG